jgi:hypothetical protein
MGDNAGGTRLSLVTSLIFGGFFVARAAFES